ncbi:nuclear factor 7, brain-like [Kryptolebias marmoratus]|nr:nuclear factor 7, brain-like [Kryptolebias marmoratus]
MASRQEDDLSCTICHDIFKNPVLLSCSHSFCKVCLENWFKRKQSKLCPVCRTEVPQSDPPLNLALRNLCEDFLLERNQPPSVGSVHLCGLHSEKLKLFCLDHKEPVCVVCRDSKSHANHKLRPIDEAGPDYRAELLRLLEPVWEQLKTSKRVKENCEETAEHIKVQARQTETQIRLQFQKLHQFLRDEEEAKITALREEKEQKIQVMLEKIEELNREIATFSDTIRETEEKLQAEDVPFLQSYNATVKKIQQSVRLDGPGLVPGALIDEAKHLSNLSYNIWNKMKEMVSYTPVTLDPNTAYPELMLSEDLTGVRRGQKQKLPKNPERFDFSISVLASEGFDSGSHSWEVEVGDSASWEVGVIAESSERTGGTGLQQGLWKIVFLKDKYIACSSQAPDTVVSLKKIRKIKVNLNWSRGRLLFSDPDTNTYIHTFRGTFTEKLFPYFNTTEEMPLRILPVNLSEASTASRWWPFA